MSSEFQRTLWSLSDQDGVGAVVPAAVVKVTGDYNSVELYVQRGPTVMLTLEADGSFVVSVFVHGADVRIEKAVDDDREFVECRPVEEING